MKDENERGERREKSLGRSAWALLAGFLVVVVLSLLTDAVLHLAGVMPAVGARMNDWQLMVAAAYRTAIAIGGSYTTARLAPHSPMKHALIGAGLGMVLATVGAVTTWNRNLGPHWYSVYLAASALPTGWIGGKLGARKAN